MRSATVRSRLLLTVLLATHLAACSEEGGTAPEQPGPRPFLVDVVAQFGAVADPALDNEPALQAALDYVAARGGGTVRIPAGEYGLGSPLVLGSHVRLLGAGRGVTVLRSLPATWGKTVAGAGVTAAIAMVAADGASVRALTVDLATAGTWSNGVVAIPAGESYGGTPPRDCEIAEIEVIAGGNHHAYLIWSLRGERIRILNNIVDGRVLSPAESFQEGIEVYGGRDVIVSGNQVRNVSGAGLNFGSAGLPDSGLDSLVVAGNLVSNAGVGLNIGPALGPTGAQDVVAAIIRDNTFEDIWSVGVHVPVAAGTAVRGLRIERNQIARVGTSENSGRGVYLQGAPPHDGQPASAVGDLVIEANLIADVRGPVGHGVLVVELPHVTITDNTITAAGHSGVYALSADSLVVAENTIADPGLFAVFAAGRADGLVVRNNRLLHWGRSQPAVAVAIYDVASGAVRDNQLVHEPLITPAVRIEESASNVIVFGNHLAAATAVPPYLNLGGNSNAGTFAVAAGVTELRVPHSLVRSGSEVSTAQYQGSSLVLAVAPDSGLFDVVLSSPALGDEHFYYLIDP